MRRTRRGSGSRSAVRYVRPAVVSLALLVCAPELTPANADPGADGIAVLIAAVAKANQRLEDLSAAVETEQESVNKAMVEVEAARDNAAAAEHELQASQQAVKDATAAIDAAQRRFNAFAAASYMNGPSDSYLTANGPDDIIAAATATRTMTAAARAVMVNLQRARTEQVNKESVARLAKQKADKAAADAKASQDAAVAALTETRRKFDEQREEVNRLAAERDAAQAKLDAARLVAWSSAGGQGAPPSGGMWDPGAGPAGGRRWDGWDPTLPMIPSANIPGDPIAVVNQVLGYSATSAQVTAQMGRNFLQQLGILKPTDTGINNAPRGSTQGRIPRVYGRQATEYVIRRGMSQIGVPYSWGGGNAAGPSRGIDSGANTVGFDCSGLVLYSFAGVGIKLPHYSGSQYNLGRKIPSAQMRRGDVIFYGPGGSQHVTIYLGDGQMLEAPDVGLKVRVAPVRTSGMTPFVVRYIEW
ncbi:NlpC/P60 family peptidoglycan endopeptidase RipA [Mycobacterium shinjukuense]|uniref:Peptidoglycan endopeptidase RipA n=1 Tax=Mycobacterium shinjukuense TaxID=398694 RepID=A0A7I7MNW7_9MYCO|nr:NlpC/P60 family peptidoglycan endopeptidase RipA [Mycobacterium shinjukuense]MCV6987636.1 NlpC/P60 family peptidoglycan endopeptidase RipA [Mycobacterium shinjukuense]ORB67355.1 peptidase M23 [Mycobacterium shinjukuense]BBX73826.1 peptidoglycan endopeptidase RipA [Mycobacterium shinjukuense]